MQELTKVCTSSWVAYWVRYGLISRMLNSAKRHDRETEKRKREQVKEKERLKHSPACEKKWDVIPSHTLWSLICFSLIHRKAPLKTTDLLSTLHAVLE